MQFSYINWMDGTLCVSLCCLCHGLALCARACSCSRPNMELMRIMLCVLYVPTRCSSDKLGLVHLEPTLSCIRGWPSQASVPFSEISYLGTNGLYVLEREEQARFVRGKIGWYWP